jgi:hypothetical protein
VPPDDREPFILLDHKPDRLELTIRVVSGALAGALIATYVCIRLRSLPLIGVVGVYVAAAAASAVLAARYGDAYWERLLRLWRR